MKRAFFISIFLLIGGCKVGPNYEPPDEIISDEWQDETEHLSTNEIHTDWWKVFDDDVLEKLIHAAALSNKEILRAESAICVARALRDVAASKLFPHISADLSAVKTYFSKNGPVFALTPGGGQAGGLISTATGLPFELQVPQIQNLYNALFDATWEIDLFGKIRRTVELAEAYVGSTIEQRNDLFITTLAEVARNYLELRSFQRRSTLTKEKIKLLEESEKITQEQYEVGYTDRLHLNEIRSELEQAKAELPDTHAQIYRNIYALALLTGEVPEALVDELLKEKLLPTPPQTVAIGLRSDLLRRRPDIRKAERMLAAATAGIGIAVASFYPTFTLLGDGGLQSLQIKKLFEGSSRTWAYGGDLNMPVFQGGRLVGTLKAAEAECCMAAYQYQNSVLQALQDAEGSLITYTNGLTSSQEIRRSTQLKEENAKLSSFRYASGLVSKLASLQSKKIAVLAEIDLLDRETKTLIDLVSLYKALGGGWEPQNPNNDESISSF